MSTCMWLGSAGQLSSMLCSLKLQFQVNMQNERIIRKDFPGGGKVIGNKGAGAMWKPVDGLYRNRPIEEMERLP